MGAVPTITEELHQRVPADGGAPLVLGIFKIQAPTSYATGGDTVKLDQYFKKIYSVVCSCCEDDAGGYLFHADDSKLTSPASLLIEAFYHGTNEQTVLCEVANTTDLKATFYRIVVWGE